MKQLRIIKQQQSGFAVLPVALILLAGAALFLFFSQKNLLVDLQITRNGYTSRLAYAAADSGLAVALTRLNDPEQRKTIFAETKGQGAYDALVTSDFTQTLGDNVEARVKLKAIALGGPDVRLRLQSIGCVSDCGRGQATVAQTVAMRGGIHRIPFALLSARGVIEASGPVTLNNASATVRGMLMHAGGSIMHDEAVQRITVSGIHPDQAEVASDKQYAQQTVDQFFLQWFGADKVFIREQSARVSCQGECTSAVAAQGSRVIWLEGDARLSSGAIGSANAPVILIASGNLQLSGSLRVTGIIYSMASITQIQLGMGSIDGAVIAEQRLNIGQGGMLSYNPAVLQRAQSTLGRFIPVPGSWSDGE